MVCTIRGLVHSEGSHLQKILPFSVLRPSMYSFLLGARPFGGLSITEDSALRWARHFVGIGPLVSLSFRRARTSGMLEASEASVLQSAQSCYVHSPSRCSTLWWVQPFVELGHSVGSALSIFRNEKVLRKRNAAPRGGFLVICKFRALMRFRLMCRIT